MMYVNPVQSGLLRQQGAVQGTTETRKTALQEFERLFLFQMIKEMRSSVPKSEFWGDNKQETLFREMMDDHLAGEMAKSGKLGVASFMEAQLQQVENAPLSPTSKAAGLPLDSPVNPLPLKRHSGLSLQQNRNAFLTLAPLRPKGLPLK